MCAQHCCAHRVKRFLLLQITDRQVGQVRSADLPVYLVHSERGGQHGNQSRLRMRSRQSCQSDFRFANADTTHRHALRLHLDHRSDIVVPLPVLDPPMALVLVHPEYGIFLGHCLGLAFWSKIDPVGQPGAPTFPSHEALHQALSTWLATEPGREQMAGHEVLPDDGTYASAAACAAAGLDPWQDEFTPVANEKPC